jgi:DNA-binding transcriptional LysR family regulator
MRHIILLVPSFLAQNPEITLDLVFSDTVVDLMQERADVAIRGGPLRNSALIARKLGSSRMAVVAAPEYLARSGMPANPRDLATHKSVGWTFFRTIGDWPLLHGKATVEISPPSVARASDGEAVRALALGGVGLARLALFHIGPDIKAGRLIPVLQDFNPGDCENVHAVFLGQGGPLPARVHRFSRRKHPAR